LGRLTNTLEAERLPGKVRNAANSGPLRGIVAVAVGGGNAVALADDGTVYAWGQWAAQPGAPTTQFPTLVPGVAGAGLLRNVVAISAGWNWTAALTQDGRVVTWGFNGTTSSYTGQGSIANVVESPGFVIEQSTRLPIIDIVALSAGYNFGLGLTSAGEVFAWGANSQGQSGQNTSDLPVTRGALKVRSGDNVSNLSGIAMVAAGGNHALALDTTGSVFSWGFAVSGQLGDGLNRPAGNRSLLPIAVVAGAGQLGNVAMVAAGFEHSLALARDGGLLIWGTGFSGNLGQGATRTITGPGASSPAPIRVLDATGSSLSFSPLTNWPNLLQRSR